MQIGAIINTNDPVGSQTISVMARQGDTTLMLDPVPPGQPLFQGLHLYYKFIDFDPGLMGTWEIIPADSSGTGPSTYTNEIVDPEFLPLIDDITLLGTPPGDHVAWTLPDLAGFDVDAIGIRVIEWSTGNHVWQDVLSPQTTSYAPPEGKLKVGVDYVYNIILSDDAGPYHENASWSFSEPFRIASLGDFDFDGDVDGRDFLVWQRGESPNPLSAGDLADWQGNYGVGSLGAVVIVPEPTTWSLLLFAVLGGFRSIRSRPISEVGKTFVPNNAQRFVLKVPPGPGSSSQSPS